MLEEDAMVEEALGEYSKRHSTVVRSSLTDKEVWLCGKRASVDEAKMIVRIFACMSLTDEKEEDKQD